MLDARRPTTALTAALVEARAPSAVLVERPARLPRVQILHIATTADWAEAVAAGVYRVSTLGVTIDQEGFIHAATPEQVRPTASRFYGDVTDPLVVLVMRTEALEAGGVPVRFEDAGTGELFPHLYAELPVVLVDEVRPAAFDGTGALTY